MLDEEPVLDDDVPVDEDVPLDEELPLDESDEELASDLAGADSDLVPVLAPSADEVPARESVR